ncbi:MAG TPA: Crp/Fnr family transcriptional regulator, partial [Alphaproteobacteria bacterium]|nr:Crp/Fnr family transcriptional regulator [Alphaproteobacteria bacterium]
SGEPLFHYDDRIEHFYIVCEGAVQLFRETADGHEATADVLLPGEFIGETDILQPRQSWPFNALAAKDSVVCELPLGWLKENARTQPVLAMNLLTILSQRTHIAAVEAEHKATMTAAQQVACFLERLCVLHDFDPRGFDLPYSKTLIASRLGMELETFSRTLSKIRDHGITVKGTHVSFQDLDAMESFVCDHCSIADNCREHELLRAKIEKPGKPA